MRYNYCREGNQCFLVLVNGTDLNSNTYTYKLCFNVSTNSTISECFFYPHPLSLYARFLHHLRIVAFLAANLLCTLLVCLYSNIILCCSNSTNRLQLSSVISSNNITLPPPFLALLLNGVEKSLVPCLLLVMDTIHF